LLKENEILEEHAMRLLTLAAALTSMVSSVSAQDYPTRPINIVVPAAAGGPTDTISRITAQAMSKFLGQQFTIENAGGAGGTIGTGRVVRADPDGYTLLIYHVGLSTAATLYRKLPYDTRSAFAAIGLVTDAPMTIIGRPDLEPDTLRELIAYLKGRGTKTTFGNAGIGSASHLCGMLFTSKVQAQLTPVPYRGTGPVMNDLIGKQIDMTCDQATNTTGPISGKQVKAYAVTTRVRLKSLPDLPTADEAGLKGFQLGVWHGVFAPNGTPPAIVQKLSAALKAALTDPELVKRFNDINTEPMPEDRATPEAAHRTLVSEINRWAPIINAAGEYAD
jgi:tripartite-type tricarboxylate transporter receptor subunit TctC